VIILFAVTVRAAVSNGFLVIGLLPDVENITLGTFGTYGLSLGTHINEPPNSPNSPLIVFVLQ